jgi:hypothetical protein
MGSSRPVSALAVLGVLGLAPAAADATAPRFTNKVIVVGKSIAGAKIGGTVTSGRNAWGSTRGQCDAGSSGQCLFQNPPTPRFGGRDAYSFFFFTGAKINVIGLTAELTRSSSDDIVPKFTSPFRGPKTSKGIGLGSKVSAVRSAYPKAKRSGKTHFTITTHSGGKRIETHFSASTKVPRIDTVLIKVVPG